MPLSAISFFMRSMVSGMEYALFSLTMPSSAPCAVPRGENAIAPMTSKSEQIRRLNMEVFSF
jgi:hypothetical protein